MKMKAKSLRLTSLQVSVHGKMIWALFEKVCLLTTTPQLIIDNTGTVPTRCTVSVYVVGTVL
jgi:hypothetical protein